MDTAVVELTVNDRCDRCGSQAYFKADKYDFSLLFCAHHGNKYFNELTSQNFTIYDESAKLNESK